MSQSKQIWPVMFWMLFASTPSWSQNSSRANVGLRRDWLNQRSLLQLDGLVQCKIFRRQGEDFGRNAFEQEAPNCAMLYIKGKYLARALDEARMFQPLPKLGFTDACYQSGWLNGYLVAYATLAPVCEAQLTTEAQASLNRRIHECESLAEGIAQDSISWMAFFSEHIEAHSRSQARQLLANMVSLVQIGRSGAAWDLMIKSQQSELFGTLPCHAAIALKLRQ